MENVFIRYVFDKKGVATESNTGLLQIEIRRKGDKKTVLIKTDIRLYKGQFSPTNGFTCVNHTNANIITLKARRMFSELEAFIYSEACASMDDVKMYTRPKSGAGSFKAFMGKLLSEKNYSYRRAKLFQWVIKKAEESGLKTFSSLTYEGICRFDTVIRKSAKEDITARKRHSILKWFCTEAVKRDKLLKNPYDLYNLPKFRTKQPVFLTEAEMKKIEEWQPVNDKLAAVKDLFIFQMYTGLAYVDMTAFGRDSIMEQGGAKVIRSSRTKTDESYLMLFLPQAEAIAEKYGYRLPALSNQKYNDYLKLLAAGVGINKKVTSHTARHTYATYLLNKGVPVESVSRAMGHSNINMTTHYARMLGKKVIEDMKKLL